VDRKNLALALEKNREFKKLILEEFCEKECARFVRMSTDPGLSPENRADALAMAQAPGFLRRWLSVVVRHGIDAESRIVDAKTEIENIRADGE
jgi:hypothetical protein